MSFDPQALKAAVMVHGTVTRIVIVAVKGSAPREIGTSMLVWANGQSGTIGGGALEYQLTGTARRMKPGDRQLRHVPLGPDLGQCCGGTATVVLEAFDKATLPKIPGERFVRRIVASGKNIKMEHENGRLEQKKTDLTYFDGVLSEPSSAPRLPVWIYGAGHVGSALVGVLSPLPDFTITWVDTHAHRFPGAVHEGVTTLVAENPGDAVKHAPDNAIHLILTYSHSMDLEICHRILQRDFSQAGLIGSKTKWARFRKRLRQLGHHNAQISRITCPIGQPKLGKHPQAIAVGVAATLLSTVGQKESAKDLVG